MGQRRAVVGVNVRGRDIASFGLAVVLPIGKRSAISLMAAATAGSGCSETASIARV